MAIFLKGTQNGQFWPKCKGGTLCKNLKIGHFLGQLCKGGKIINTSRILALISMDGFKQQELPILLILKVG